MFNLIGRATSRFGKPVSGDAPPPAAPLAIEDLRDALQRVEMAAGELDAVGRDTESVRNRCVDIIGKVASLATLESDLQGVFEQMDFLLREFERAKAELSQRNAILAMEREANASLRSRFKTAHDENEARKAEIDLMTAENGRLQASVRRLEARVEELEKEARVEAELLAVAESDLQNVRGRLAFALDESKAAREDFNALDLLVSGLQSDVAAERHRTALNEESMRSLQASLTDSQQQSARLKTDLDDTNLSLLKSGQRGAALEAERDKLQADLAQIRSLWQQEADAHASDVAALQAEVESARALSQAAERLLTENRDMLQVQTDRTRQEERRAQDAAAAGAQLEQKLQASEAANADFARRVAELESARDALLERTRPLVKRVEEQDSEIAKLRQQGEAAQNRLLAETKQFEADRERLETSVKELTESLENERAMKALAEGALREDRRERAQLQQALHSARTTTATGEAA